MHSRLIPLLCLALFAAPHRGRCDAAAAETVDPEQIVIGQMQDAVEARLPDRPEDAGLWHVSLMVHDDWLDRPEERALIAAFEADPTLIDLRRQTHFHIYTASDRIYQARFARTCPTLPVVLVQRSSGEVVYKVSGGNLQADLVAHQIALAIEATRRVVCPDGRCPVPRPAPSPSPGPGPGPIDLPEPATPEDPAHAVKSLRERLQDRAVDQIPDIITRSIGWPRWITDSRLWMLIVFLSTGWWGLRKYRRDLEAARSPAAPEVAETSTKPAPDRRSRVGKKR